MALNVIETLHQLIRRQKTERDIGEFDVELVSLGPWASEIDYVTNEQELHLIFESLQAELCSVLGQPIYSGLRSAQETDLSPQKYFFEYQSALRFVWWEHGNLEVLLMITGHDADTLQLLRIAISSISLSKSLD
ncbi:hypothetical protein [Acaryochloris sp. CCMEE 5410]|uniref:hypothetical protein n=1 Tax=Acaryochloris sp. CCMEE 5410 TaxID=310037 RepID=UPI000248392D|nr:hypothetical protein [Acaryochloris sp. CCMEE 5410]KAI9134251.1 hypothetical protein ON05_013825 [Acaryochloris sp. CCMEE 5410]